MATNTSIAFEKRGSDPPFFVVRPAITEAENLECYNKSIEELE